MRSRERQTGLTITAILLLAILHGVQTIPTEVGAHFTPEMTIFSNYTANTITIDGDITSTEWSGATIVNLAPIPFNTVSAYMLVMNDDFMLYIAYDVVGDTSEGPNDSAGLAFDGNHNGAPNALGDGEYSVRASNDTSCLPYSSVRCHYVYSGSGDLWVPSDPMDQTKPFQSGLWAEVGFGTTARSGTPHRTFEFSIPLALIGQPAKTVVPGDIVGFYASRHVSPYVGVWDADTSKSASWPANAPLGPNSYGHLQLAAQSSASVNPDYSYKPATPSQPALHTLTVRNIGRNQDSFDFRAVSSLGWNVTLLDNQSVPLTNHGGNVSLPDIGPVQPQASAKVIVEVTPPGGTVPGTSDIVTFETRPWSNPTKIVIVRLRSSVPFAAPWSDNFEGVSLGWAPLTRPVNDWAFGSPSPSFPGGPAAAYSGSNVWGTNLGGNYSSSSFSVLETPCVKIPDYVLAARLAFWHWYSIIGPYGDGAWIEVSQDGGPWSVLSPQGGYPEQRFGGQAAYSGSSGAWIPADFNITSFAGKSIAFRFILWDWMRDGRAGGWYIDDVSVQVSYPAAGVRIIPSTGFMVGSKLSILQFVMKVQNIGASTDVFDLSFSQVLGWNATFLDVSDLPLDDTERPRDGFVDTGQVVSGDVAIVKLNVTIPDTATPGDIESITIVFRSSLDISVSANGQYRFQLAVPLPFLDMVESGVNGWTVESGSLWHQVDSCQPSPPAWYISYSPCHSWWYGQDLTSNYNTGARTYGNLTSPAVELFSVTYAYMSFRYWYHTEPTLEYDQRWILVKVDNNPWPKKGEPGAFQMGVFQDKTWLLNSLNMSSYIGHIVQVRFYFDSKDGQNNNYQGWYVDDVNISAYVPGSLPPNIALTRPLAGELLTAAYPQPVVWLATDDSDPPVSLKVWVNYSLTGSAPWSPISTAQGVRGDSSPIIWVTPCANTTTAALNATVSDSLSQMSWTGPVQFGLDCRRPQVITSSPHSPPDVSVKSNISVTFSETMNRSATQAAFGLYVVQGWIPVSGTFTWTGNRLYFDTQDDLLSSQTYQVNITTQATDVSKPGNGLATQYSWQFTTSSHADSPPYVNISSPKGGEHWSGSRPTAPVFKSVSWSIEDDFDIKSKLKAWVNYTVDGGGNWTPIAPAQPFNGTLEQYTWRVPCVNSSSVMIEFIGIDTGGRWSRNVTPAFEIDCSPPKIISHQPVGSLVTPFATIEIRFNESMNQPLTEAAFDLLKLPEYTPIAGLFSWGGNIMTFDPVQNLVRGATYQANLTTLTADASDPGNRLEYPMSWQFTVALLPPPKVESTNPMNGSSNVAVDLAVIDISFDTQVTVYPGAVNVTPFVGISTEQIGNVLRIHVLSRFAHDTQYRVRLNASLVMDSSGSRLDGNSDGTGGDDFIMTFRTAPPDVFETLPLPAWVWSLLLMVVGFIASFFFYRWRVKKEEERRRKVPKKTPSPYEGTIGPEDEASELGTPYQPETPDLDLSGPDRRPPF